MRLSKASAYAVFATANIAEHERAGPVRGADIAEACGIPPEYLRKILQQLVRGRILDSEAGRRGGFRLRKPQENTTLLEIVEAIDGPLNGDMTVRDEVIAAGDVKNKLRALCASASQATKELLKEVTIKHLISTE